MPRTWYRRPHVWHTKGALAASDDLHFDFDMDAVVADDALVDVEGAFPPLLAFLEETEISSSAFLGYRFIMKESKRQSAYQNLPAR